MKKRFKLLTDRGRVHILKWVVDGKLFGPDWDSIANFEDNTLNKQRCKTIIKLLNECDTQNHLDNDRKRNT